MNSNPSEYLRHLPAILRAPSPRTGRSFLGEFLKTFEAILTGRADVPSGSPIVPLETRIDRFHEHLGPATTPVDSTPATPENSAFLDYLAGWVALAFDQNWDLTRRRAWLDQIVPLYRRRGTRAGIQAYLAMFVGEQVTIDEPPGGFVVGVFSTVAESTFIAGAPAHFFRVRIAYAFGTTPFVLREWLNLQSGTRAIVDLEKPAHTYYLLDARTPGFVVGNHSTIATDTLLWEHSQPFTD